jgi:hypothetical protein
VLVVVDPRSAACAAIEAPVETLASGLAHERGVTVMALDVSNPEAAQFAARILGVTALPAVLVYPEAAPGCLAYRGEAGWRRTAGRLCEDLLSRSRLCEELFSRPPARLVMSRQAQGRAAAYSRR